MDRVLVAANDSVVGYNETKHVKDEKLQTPIREGVPLPIAPNNKMELYQLYMKPENFDGYHFVHRGTSFLIQ